MPESHNVDVSVSGGICQDYKPCCTSRPAKGRNKMRWIEGQRGEGAGGDIPAVGVKRLQPRKTFVITDALG